MANALSTLLNPARRADESRDKYKERRTAAQDYTLSSLAGTLAWNPNLQGTYFNDGRKNRPIGKSGHRIAKKLARLARERGVVISMDKAAEGADQTAVATA